MLDGPTSSPSTILLIEDDQRLGEIQRDFLKDNGFFVHWQSHGRNVQKTISETKPDIIILDLALPGANGLDICREIGPNFSGRIIVVTSSEDDFDHVAALELGADDFLSKPVNLRVLLAHLRALLRREKTTPRHAEKKDQIEFGKLTIKLKTQEVIWDKSQIKVSNSEFKLLWHLALNADEIMERNELFRATRGIDFDGTDRSVDSKIVSLRKKLKDSASSPRKIITVRNKGYLFTSDAWN